LSDPALYGDEILASLKRNAK
jgi:hypothetical protein